MRKCMFLLIFIILGVMVSAQKVVTLNDSISGWISFSKVTPDGVDAAFHIIKRVETKEDTLKVISVVTERQGPDCWSITIFQLKPEMECDEDMVVMKTKDVYRNLPGNLIEETMILVRMRKTKHFTEEETSIISKARGLRKGFDIEKTFSTKEGIFEFIKKQMSIEMDQQAYKKI